MKAILKTTGTIHNKTGLTWFNSLALFFSNCQTKAFRHVRYIHVFGLIALLIPFLFSGCSGAAEESPEAIRQEISQYNSQINDLTLKINNLEKVLEAMGERPLSRNQVPVTVIELERSNFSQYFTAAATVEAVQQAIISPETNGQLKELLVKKGQQVQAGQVVARLNTSVISGNISEVETSLDLARTVYNRQKELWDQQIGSEMQYLEARNTVKSLESRLETLQSQKEMAVIKAPFDGIVDDIYLKEGELAMPGSRIMLLLNLKKLFVNADIAESHLGAIRSGDTVILRFPSYPDFEKYVPVYRIGNTINPENRTFRVQLQIENSDEQFKPNMMANMSINTLTVEDAITIPSILIKQDLQGHYVYTAQESNGDTIAKKTYIDRGPDGEGLTMINNGINEGEYIIELGHNQVTDGSLIRMEESPSNEIASEI